MHNFHTFDLKIPMHVKLTIWKACEKHLNKKCAHYFTVFSYVFDKCPNQRQACETVCEVLFQKDGVFTVSRWCSHLFCMKSSHVFKIYPFQTMSSWLPNIHGNSSKNFTWMYDFSGACEKNGKHMKIHYSCVLIIIIVYDLIEKNIWLKKKELLLLASTQTCLIKRSKDIPLFSTHFW